MAKDRNQMIANGYTPEAADYELKQDALAREQRARDLWSREGGHCVSYLVSTLAQAYGAAIASNERYGSGPQCDSARDMAELTEQAMELCAPLQDFEEAAIQAGWRREGGKWIADNSDEPGTTREASDPVLACVIDDIEPYQREVFEHWIVSGWLADQLANKGEKVNQDFAGLTVWARTTTGQAVYADHVFEQIAADLHR